MASLSWPVITVGKSLDGDGPATVIIHMELRIGSIKEIGMGGLKQGWVSAERNGLQLSITSGAGLGNGYLEATIDDGKDSLYAQADIQQFGALIWDAMIDELRKRQKARDEGAGDEASDQAAG